MWGVKSQGSPWYVHEQTDLYTKFPSLSGKTIIQLRTNFKMSSINQQHLDFWLTKNVHPLCRLHAVLCSIISLLKTVSYPFALTGINISPNWHWYCIYTALVIACQVLTESEPSVTVHWINMRCGYDYTMCLCVCVCVCAQSIEYFIFWVSKCDFSYFFYRK